jgi:undecaprenyl-diphosphatase
VDFLQILILALVQALTEFLPISSSAHLYLVSEWFGWDYQGLTFDLGLHLGTLFAVIAYYRRDLRVLTDEALRWRPGQALTPNQRLVLAIGLATIPAGVVAMLMTDALQADLRNDWTIGLFQIVFGLLMYAADRWFRRDQHENSLTIGKAMLVGCAQALALMPGVSRSGVTMTAALFLGLSREAAARFSFLLSIPVVALASAMGVYDLLSGKAGEAIRIGDFFLGAVIAAVAGYAVIAFLLAVLKRAGVAPFMGYRVVLGLFLLAQAAWRLP